MDTVDFLATLHARDLLADQTDGLKERARASLVGSGPDARPLAGYVGFDPSSDSLHVGHLTSIRMLSVLAASGGRAIALIGGATGQIGDPSGKSEARAMLDNATLDQNRVALERQLRHLLGPDVEVLDNRTWLGAFGLLDFLCAIGTHASLHDMLARDSVSARLASGGMSFTEFSYALLQATDFLTLHRDAGVELQMGGSDQWGNITAGIDLIRRVTGRGEGGGPAAFGAVAPLLLTADGRKMGKTETGAVFLDPAKTSPFAFFQFWLNAEDALVGTFLRRLTDLSLAEISALEQDQVAAPGERPAQRALAFALTAWVHGPAVAELQQRVAQAAFSVQAILDPVVLAELHAETAGFVFSHDDLAAGAAALTHVSGLAKSRGDARRLIAGGGVTVGAARIASPDESVELVAGEWVVVRVGRRRVAVGRLG